MSKNLNPLVFGRAQPKLMDSHFSTSSEGEAFSEKTRFNSSCKYLSVLLDNNLNFEGHVDHVTKNGK